MYYGQLENSQFLPFYSLGLNLPSPRPGVPVWRLPSPSRSMHLGDVSETSKTRPDHVIRTASAARSNDA